MFIQNKNIKILLNYGVGPLLFAWLAWSIYHQVIRQPDFSSALEQLWRSFSGSQSWKLWLAFLLVAVNWGIEARKWQVLLDPMEEISFLRAFKAVLAGVAFAMNTPNRIGEYGGRVLYVKDGHRWQAVSLTVIGSISQLMITLFCGTGGLLFILVERPMFPGTGEYALWLQFILYVTVFTLIAVSLLYFRIGRVIKWLEKFPGTGRFTGKLAVAENLPVTILLRVLCLSFARYIVFAVQYILLLQLSGVAVGAGTAFGLVAVLYLLLAVIPTIALAELGIMGKLSLLLFMTVSGNKLGIITATTMVWLMNLVIPALAGSLLFLGIKIVDNK
jgi:uncharacterized membrane protein YbhN (UPF0104 family)